MWFVNYRKVSPACTHAQEEAFTMSPGVSSTISLAWATNDLFPLGSHAELLLCPWVTPLVLWFLCSNSPGQLWCSTTGPLSPPSPPVCTGMLPSYMRQKSWRTGLCNLLLRRQSSATSFWNVSFMRTEPCHHHVERNLTLRLPWEDPGEATKQSNEGRVCGSVVQTQGALLGNCMQMLCGFVETMYNVCGIDYM